MYANFLQHVLRNLLIGNERATLTFWLSSKLNTHKDSQRLNSNKVVLN